MKCIRITLIGLGLLALAGCAAYSDKARMEMFEATARSYERAIRWSEFEAAYRFVRAPADIPAPDFQHLKNIRVTNYEDVNAKLQPDGKTVQQLIRVQYVHVNRMTERSLTAVQLWTFDEKEKRWQLTKGFPEFR